MEKEIARLLAIPLLLLSAWIPNWRACTGTTAIAACSSPPPTQWSSRIPLDDLTRRVAANLRSYDALCRYGANHFLILLPHVKNADVAGIARRVRVQAAGYALTLADGGKGFVTASTGGVMLDTGIGMQENIDRAAAAFRAARWDGGNNHRMWAPAAEHGRPTFATPVDA